MGAVNGTYWISSDGAFEDLDNWSAGVPGQSDSATIAATGSYTVTVNDSATIGDLTLGSGATLDITFGLFSVSNGVTDNEGSVVVESNAQLLVDDSFVNNGLLQLNGGSLLVNGALTLSGSGTINLANAAMVVSSTGGVLTNSGQLITGAGQIGNQDDGITFVNAGTVDANVSGGTLTLFTGNQITNAGTLEATDGGTLNINDSLSSPAGTVFAIGGSSSPTIVNINGYFDGGPLVATGAGAQINVNADSVRVNMTADDSAAIAVSGHRLDDDLVATANGGSALLQDDYFVSAIFVSDSDDATQISGVSTLDGGGYGTTISSGGVILAADSSTTVLGDLVVNGVLSMAPSASDGQTNLYIRGAVALSGSGTVVLNSGGLGAYIAGAPGTSGDTLSNSATIEGDGYIGAGDGSLTFTNNADGVVNANVSGGTLTLNTGNQIVNVGTLEATDGGTLNINDSLYMLAGMVSAVGGSSTPTIVNVNAFANGGGFSAVGSGAQININADTTTTTLQGDDLGVIAVSGRTLTDDNITSTNGGSALLQDDYFLNAHFSGDSDDSTQISGVSTLDGRNYGTAINSGGVTLAADSSTTVLGSLVVNGVLALAPSASDGQTNLYIQDSVALSGSGTVVLNSGGLGAYIAGAPGTSGDTLSNSATIEGAGYIGAGDGSLTFTNNADGVVNANVSGGTLTIATGNTVTNAGTLEATDGGTLNIDDAIYSPGGTILAVAPAGTTATVNIYNGVDGGNITAEGPGAQVNIYAGVQYDTILADDSAVISASGQTFINAGFNVTNGGVELLQDDYFAGALFIGDSPGGLQLSGVSTLDGTAYVTRISGDVSLAADSSTTVIGDLNLFGVLSVEQPSWGGSTYLYIQGSVTLSGGGTLTMDEMGYGVWIAGVDGWGSTLTNSDATIDGVGNIGDYSSSLTFVNQATVTADVAYNGLTISTGNEIVNSGTMTANAEGALLQLFDQVDNTGGVIEALQGQVIANDLITGGSLTADGPDAVVTTSGGASGVDIAALNRGTVQITGGTVSGSTLTASGDGSTIQISNGYSGFSGIVDTTLATSAGGLISVSSGSFTNVSIQAGAQVLVQDGGALVFLALPQSPTETNDGAISIGDAVNATGTTLSIDGDVTLAGAGSITLNSGTSGAAQISGANGGGTLTNNGNTLYGAGYIGSDDNFLTFSNAAGAVIANVAGQTLTITTHNLVTNSASLQALSGGTLTIDDAVNNFGGLIGATTTDTTTPTVNLNGAVSGGTIYAIGAGAKVNLNASSSSALLRVANGGVLSATSGALTDDTVLVTTGGQAQLKSVKLTNTSLSGGAANAIQLANVNLDGTAAANTISGYVAAIGGSPMFLGGSLVDNGIFTLASGVYLYTYGGAALSGRGKITMNAGQSTFSAGISSSDPDDLAFTNAATINGSGSLVSMQLVNTGKIASDAGYTIALLTDDDIVNQGVLMASGAGSTLWIDDSVNNGGGLILAQSGGHVKENGGLSGGTLTASAGFADLYNGASSVTMKAYAGGAISVLGGDVRGSALTASGANSLISLSGGVSNSTLATSSAGLIRVNGATFYDDTINAGAQVLVQDGGQLTLEGALANSGVLSVGDVNNSSVTTLTIDGDVTLSGAGKLQLNPSNGVVIVVGSNVGGALTNQGETITGSGSIGFGPNALTFANLAGKVSATGVGSLLSISTGNIVTNKATLQATNGGDLEINDEVDNSGGLIQALAATSTTTTVNVYSDVSGGMLYASGQGAVVGVNADTTGVTLRAYNSGVIAVKGSTLSNDVIYANNGGQALLQNANIVGGSLKGDTASALRLDGVTLDGSSTATTFTGAATVVGGSTLTLKGSFVDTGVLTLAAPPSGSSTALEIDGAVSLSGRGAIQLNRALIAGDGAGDDVVTNVNVTIHGTGTIGSSDGKLTLINSGTIKVDNASNTLVVSTGNTIVNTGTLSGSNFGAELWIKDSVNNTGGLITALNTGLVVVDGLVTGGNVTLGADNSGGIVVLNGGVVNAKLTGGGILANGVSGSTVTANAGSTINLKGAVSNSTLTVAARKAIVLYGGAEVSNTTMATAVGGVIAVDDAIFADGVTIKSGAQLLVSNDDDLYLHSALGNAGQISIGSASYDGGADLWIGGAVTLNGAGKVVLNASADDDASSYILGETSGSTLTNQGNTISGWGAIGSGGDANLTLDNAAGYIIASGGELKLQTGNVLTNESWLEAVSGGLLTIDDNVGNSSAGVVVAFAGSSGAGVVDLNNQTTTGGRLVANGGEIDTTSATISGAVLTATAGGAFVFNGATLTGGARLAVNGSGSFTATGAVTLDGSTTSFGIGAGVNLQVADTALTLKGVIANKGAISSSSPKSAYDVSGTVTLNGGGALNLTSLQSGAVTGAGFIYGDAATGGVLANYNNVISGDGNIGGGAGALRLVNLAGGVINATGPDGLSILTGSLVSNYGLMEATNPFGLNTTGGLTINDSVYNVGTIFADGGDVHILGALSGSGTIEIGAGSTATLDGAATNSVTFAGAGELVLNKSTGLSGAVSGFGADDTIDFGDFAAAYTTISQISGTGAAGTTTNITLTDVDPSLGHSVSATLHLLNQFDGQYGTAMSDYALNADTRSTPGTLLTLAPTV